MSDTSLHGLSLVSGRRSEGDATRVSTFNAHDPVSGAAIEPSFHEADAELCRAAMHAAHGAHPRYEQAGRARRAQFLEAIAEEIESLGDALLERAHAECALPMGRLKGERGRTCAQLRRFAAVVREGSYLGLRIDPALPERTPMPRVDLRRMNRALGPVVVFGASNFPLAFSVAGGDTAAALAAGCPVVVKAHPAHPGTSELVGEAVERARKRCELPAGVFNLVQGSSNEVGANLVRDPAARAVAFTGSLAGGRALFDLASARPQPIPVFAEMGSVNPVLLLPSALDDASKAQAAGEGLAASLVQGVGQFCTNPGLILGLRSEGLSQAVEALAAASAGPRGVMLHRGILSAYTRGLGQRNEHPALTRVGTPGKDVEAQAHAAVFTSTGADFLAHPELAQELFGPSALVVQCEDSDQLARVIDSLEGQLTATVQGASDSDLAVFGGHIDALEQRVGRLLFAGVPTGVEVCDAMHHGGPYPATTAPGTTSVGSAAIDRFVRPLCYQDAPQARLPAELRDANPQGLLRLVDGAWSRDSL